MIMRNILNYSNKTIVAVTAFVLFWIATLVYVLPIKFIRQKTPNIAWQYDQLFGQKWNFFTQPSLANNQLFFVLKNTTTNRIIDSVDILKILWDSKKNNAPFNTKEDILDHIALRQITILNEAIYYHKNTQNVVSNLSALGKLMLENKGLKIDRDMQFKIFFYEKAIKNFNHSTQEMLMPQLKFESNYQYFK